MAYGACYLKGTRFFDRGGMIAGASPRSARWPIGIAAFGLCLPFIIKNSGSARESAGNNRKEGVHVTAAPAPLLNQWGSRKTPSPSDSISLLTLYMWAPDIYEGSPTPVTAFLSIAPKISISANISRVSIYGALAAMAQTKVKRPLAHSSIGHVGYIRTGFSCGTIEGIQSLLIGIFIYALMTIDAFAIVSALRQTRVKYIADLGALAKTNPISAITFSITMFSYAGIPPLIHQLVYSISLFESTITTRDEPWFGELKLALGVIGLPVTARDRILRCSPPVVGTTRAGPANPCPVPGRAKGASILIPYPHLRPEMEEIEQIWKKNHIENVPNPTPSFVELCIRQVKLVSCMMGNYLLRFGEDSAVTKRMFFDTPRTWILYEPMDRNKSLLLAMTSSFITSSFLYPSPLFSVTHQMALSSYL
ncbi:hypothetical protein ES288_A09G071100v1 [Gossypium darwinii]|uniref:NADH:quinone oxidoreductase/Mrp antiporter transmembrane domain-containing protein n=1 Tax=Gossypium darwinii TaxID=34276 RepID=A0A5D2F7Z3_GOSDA|nr:hypothetical protein ES288_A09G071100v1 [Gossypium darwinii]